jgi:periplasmic divalent cation tolerance protein
MKMTDKIVVFSTCGSAEEAQRVSQALVEAKLAACVNILPGVQSVYEWQGRVENTAEWLLVIKSRQDLFPRLAAELRRVHSYKVPEAIAIPITDGLPEYLSWMDSGLQLPVQA